MIEVVFLSTIIDSALTGPCVNANALVSNLTGPNNGIGTEPVLH